jgi:hypothetical protein
MRLRGGASAAVRGRFRILADLNDATDSDVHGMVTRVAGPVADAHEGRVLG